MKILENINNPQELRNLKEEQLPVLAQELRNFIINIVSVKEGHLGASLGVVELTIAIHYVFNTPTDLLVWDVGHQAYGHKILTERRDVFHTNRQLNGIAGFPKITESIYDTFGVGHSSTSISAALGMAIASGLNGDIDKQHIVVIGDASISSGMAFEALNNAGVSQANLLIILNDNAIGIDTSVGALINHFSDLRNNSNTGNNFFETLNLNYNGTIDGNDIFALVKELRRLQKKKGINLLHISTIKGKGLPEAEKHQVKYHAPGKFNAETGVLNSQTDSNTAPKYQDVFGLVLLDLAKRNAKIVGVTPAMPTGCSMKFMMDVFPERTFDVGIAEQHAVTFSAGLATQGMVVFCNIYSTFLQRSYDQIIHDVALQNIPIILCIDRAGIVGEDGATHHGIFDIAFLRCIPNLIVCAPINEVELQNIMFAAQQGLQNPIAIRYPRGRGKFADWQSEYFGKYKSLEIGKAICLIEGTEIAVLSTGTIGNNVEEAIAEIKSGKIAHYHFPFIKPLDIELLRTIFASHKTILTVEDGCAKGGFGSAILEFSSEEEYTRKIIILGIPDEFIEHGTVEELHRQCKLDSISLRKIFSEHI